MADTSRDKKVELAFMPMNAGQLQTELVLREARHGDRIQALRGQGRPAPSVQGSRGMNASGWMSRAGTRGE